MIRLYFVGVVGLLVAVWFGLDWYMSNNQLSWKAIWVVWPFWALSTVVGFLLGGFALGVAAEYAYMRDSKVLQSQYEADKTTYKQSVNNDLKEEKSRLERLEEDYTKRSIKLDQQHLDGEQKIKDVLKAQKREHKAAMKAAADTQAKAEQLILATKAENETLKKRALNASKMLERIKKKINS